MGQLVHILTDIAVTTLVAAQWFERNTGRQFRRAHRRVRTKIWIVQARPSVDRCEALDASVESFKLLKRARPTLFEVSEESTGYTCLILLKESRLFWFGSDRSSLLNFKRSTLSLRQQPTIRSILLCPTDYLMCSFLSCEMTADYPLCSTLSN